MTCKWPYNFSHGDLTAFVQSGSFRNFQVIKCFILSIMLACIDEYKNIGVDTKSASSHISPLIFEARQRHKNLTSFVSNFTLNNKKILS